MNKPEHKLNRLLRDHDSYGRPDYGKPDKCRHSYFL